MTELLNCPFCGGAGALCETSVWWVRCDGCGAEAECHESREVAAANWNRRAEARQAPLPAGAVTEAVRELVAASRRVVRKYGIDKNGEPSDWTEWQDVRDAADRLEAAFAARPVEPVAVNVCGVAVIDALASEIRRVDGDNALGAGALAEALMPFIRSALVSAPAPGLVEALRKVGVMLKRMEAGTYTPSDEELSSSEQAIHDFIASIQETGGAKE